MRWARHVGRMGQRTGAYRVFVGKPEGTRPLGRLKHRWEDNIKMDLLEVGREGMSWIDVAKNRERLRPLVKAIMNLRVVQNERNILTENRLASQEGLCSMK